MKLPILNYYLFHFMSAYMTIGVCVFNFTSRNTACLYQILCVPTNGVGRYTIFFHVRTNTNYTKEGLVDKYLQ